MTLRSTPSICAVAALLLCACSDSGPSDTRSGTEVEVAEFRVNECKANESGKLLSGVDTWDYTGLQCLAWDFDHPGRPAIDLINWPEGCGFGGFGEGETLWQGEARRQGRDDLELRVEWNFEAVSACVGCYHDFSFQLDGFESMATLQITVQTRSCTGEDCPWEEDVVTLPVGETPSGVTCRYRTDFDKSAPRGTLHSRTRPAGTASPCDDGLVPLLLDKFGEICAASCAEDSDCPLPDLLTCQESVCRLAHPW